MIHHTSIRIDGVEGNMIGASGQVGDYQPINRLSTTQSIDCISSPVLDIALSSWGTNYNLIIIGGMNAQSPSPSRLPIHSLQNPFTHSINPQSPLSAPYNFHDSPSTHPSSPINAYSPRRQPPIPSQNLNLADKQSFARNFRGRLYGTDLNQQQAKQLKQQKYREELLMQAEEDRRRKQQAKERADAQDAKLQREFYDNIRIQAQKKGIKKEEPSYFMMRTSRGVMRKQASLANSRTQVHEGPFLEPEEKKGIPSVQFSRKENLKRTLYDHPKIMKRGGYHNQSSLDPRTSSNPNPEQNAQHPPQQPATPRVRHKNLSKSMNVRPNQFQAQMRYQQQRIRQILMFQQHMLKKLDYFKKDVIVASQNMNLDDELDKVRVKLRAKPLNMDRVHHLSPREGIDNVMEDTSFYHLPLISPKNKIYEGTREVKHRREKQARGQKQGSQQMEQEEQREVVKLEDRRGKGFNDKNMPLPIQEPEERPRSQQAA